jgi:hypothetical protein
MCFDSYLLKYISSMRVRNNKLKEPFENKSENIILFY